MHQDKEQAIGSESSDKLGAGTGARFKCHDCGTPLNRAFLMCPSCECVDPTGFFTGGRRVAVDDDEDDEDDD